MSSRLISWIASHKVLIAFIFATIFLFASTIVLALQNLDLRDELYDCEDLHITTTEAIPQLTTEAPMDISKFRLPSGVTPNTYDLTLKPWLEQGTFDGTAKISIDVQKAVNELRLHSNGLNIKFVKVNSVPTKYRLEPDYELLIIEKPMEMGTIIDVDIEFSGSMLDRIVGLYSSTYKSNGQSR